MARHYYSLSDINELESHLLDTTETEVNTGVSEQDAFWMAIARIGDESVLRSQYQRSWSEFNPLKKLWRLFRSEGMCFSGFNSRGFYTVSHIVSLVFGAVATNYQLPGIFMVATGQSIWESGRPVFEQGVFLTGLVGLEYF